MSAVLTSCPATGQSIATGIDTDPATWRKVTDFVGRVFCPHCRTEHEWAKVKSGS